MIGATGRMHSAFTSARAGAAPRRSNVYAEVDLEMKAKALANCEVKHEKPSKPWREDKGLMEFLRTL